MTSTTASDAADEYLERLLDGYRAELERVNYSKATIEEYQGAVRRLWQIMRARGVRVVDLTPNLAGDLVRHEPTRVGRRPYAVTIARRFAGFLAARGVAKPSIAPTARELARAELRREYEDYLRRQRGLSDRTIADCWRFADRFLTYRFGEADTAFSAITPRDVAAFLHGLYSRKAPYRDKTPPTHLRNFFQYLFKRGLTQGNLALCVLSVAQQPYDARLPRHLTPAQVEAVLAAVRAEEPHSRRNHAMVLLQARLGLRAPEVVAMRLDDLDWRRGEFTVHGKARRDEAVPLPRDVGEAIADYLRHGRPETEHRGVFLRLLPPRRGLSVPAVTGVVYDACERVGLPHIGAHRLRRSAASTMLAGGASLAEVGEALRQRSATSTAIYAKVDRTRLAALARPWPGSAR